MNKRKSFPFLILVGGSIPVVTILTSYYGITQDFIIIFVVIVGLVFGSMVLWNHANAHATGNEWWQDDHCSGWRGY